MKFYVLTLFPEMIEQAFHTSVTGKAVESGRITLETVNIRDYTRDRHHKADDYPYGGGAGMLMQAQPVYDACQAVKARALSAAEGTASSVKKLRCIYVTPQGTVFTQEMAEELAKEEELVFLCGHYEGIDERVLEEIVTDYVSIGDYVLTGGELPAMVMMDAVARLVPDVLHNKESAETESFHRHLLEHPHYTRPEVWRGRSVPGVLLSGNHQKIEEWRLEESVRRTRERRPDLYDRYLRLEEITARLMKEKVLHIDMIDALNRGCAKLLYADESATAIQEKRSGIFELSAVRTEAVQPVLKVLPDRAAAVIVHQESLLEALTEKEADMQVREYRHAVYTRGVPFPAAKEIRIAGLPAETAEEQLQTADIPVNGFVPDSFYGAFVQDRIVGWIGMDESGSMGIVYVREEYRRQGIAAALEADCINRLLRAGRTAFCRIPAGNQPALALQEKLGLRISKQAVYLCSRTAVF